MSDVIEQGTRWSQPLHGTEVLREGWFYLDTFLRDGPRYPNPKRVTLFVIRAQRRRSARGREWTVTDFNVLVFADDDAMVEWIDAHDAEELPPEADGALRTYVPESFRD